MLGHSLAGVVGLALASGRLAVSVQAVTGLRIKVTWTEQELDSAQAAVYRLPARLALHDEGADGYLHMSGLAGFR